MIDFLYTEDSVASNAEASARFKTLESIVADYMYACSQDFMSKTQMNEHQSSLKDEPKTYK